MRARLSVILSNYNHAHFLGNALNAIVTQSRRPDEVIIIDDASTDDSRKVIEVFCSREPVIKAVFNERNIGVVGNTNHGVKMATGDYVFLGAADDCVLPGFFENSMRLVEQFPGVGLVCSDPVWFRESIERMTVTPLPLGTQVRMLNPSEFIKAQQAWLFLIPTHTSLIRRDAALGAGLHNTDLKWYSDWFMNLVIAFRERVAYLPGGFSAMRLSQNSYSAAGTRKWSNQKPVLEALVRHLRSPEYSDVRHAFVDSGVLSEFGSQMLQLAAGDHAARQMLTPLTLRRAFGAATRGTLRPFVPNWVMHLYRKTHGGNKERRVLHKNAGADRWEPR